MSTIIIITVPVKPRANTDEPDGFAQALDTVTSGDEAKRLIDEAVINGGSVRIVNDA